MSVALFAQVSHESLHEVHAALPAKFVHEIAPVHRRGINVSTILNKLREEFGIALACCEV